MALILNSDKLKKRDGTPLPETGVFVKFIMQSDFESFNQKFFLRFYTSHTSKVKGYSPIDILFIKTEEIEEIEETTTEIPIPNSFVKELDIQQVGYYEMLVEQILPNASERTYFTYHLFVKEFLENITGENSVVIRPDLS